MVQSMSGRLGVALVLLVIGSAVLAMPALAAAPGAIVSWGDDRTGQVSATPSGTGFTAIAAGDRASLALRADGSIVSWGDDAGGLVSDTPQGTGFTAIAVGSDTAHALRADGSIASWGLGEESPWGDPDYGRQLWETPSGTGFTAIAAGDFSSHALCADGSIVSWGTDHTGQVLWTPSGTGFTAIAAGPYVSHALRADGSIVSWGSNDYGQVSQTPSGTGFTAIAAGPYASHALRADGSIVSWGEDRTGLVSQTPSGTGYTAIAAGYTHSLALRADGSIVCWGAESGQIPQGTGFTAIAARFQTSFALQPDTTPPAIASTSPVDGAVNVPIETNAITFEFSEPIRYVPSSGIQVSLVTSTDRGYVDYPMGEITASGTTLTIAAPAGTAPWFENWKDYCVTVYGVQDLAGNDMATAGNLIRFHTVSTDTTPPTVDSTSPGDGALGTTADAAITATMSETINACVGTITIVDDLGNAVPLEEGRGWDTSDYRTVEIHPAGPLTPGRTYTVTMAGMIDGYLNEMAPYSWSFAVGSAPVADAGPDLTVIVNEMVAFEGSGSTDADGAIVSYAWDFGDGTTGTGMTASHTYMASGAYTVSLQVTDNDGLEGSDTLMVMVRTPDEATEDLAETVDGMDLRADIETGLTDKLDLAIAALNAENGKMAINNLNAFISLVKAQRGKALTAPQASVLTAEAQRIVQNIRLRSVS